MEQLSRDDTDRLCRDEIEQLFGPEETPQIPGLTFLKSAMRDHCLELEQEMDQWFQTSNQYIRFGSVSFPLLEQLAIQHWPKTISDRKPLFDQIIGNKYQPGEGLIPHIDLQRFEDGILILNVKGTCRMTFEHQTKVSVFLGVGDVLLLEGESRWQWKHGIPEQLEDEYNDMPVKRTERYSLTLRKLKDGIALC
ncbi:hypothetical protein EDD86DRAFT_191290 [Gorgonomyces haynaldii]|nr:hypothetical protein EDD86DRAFT_191290 [Gorgonomyces haynaldii]